MDTYIKFVTHRPIMVIGLLTVITLLLGIGIPKLEFDNSAEVMMPKKDSRYIFNEEVKKIYGKAISYTFLDKSPSDTLFWKIFYIGRFFDLETK